MTIPAYSPVPVNNANIVTFIVSDPLVVGFAALRTASPGADAPLLTAANAQSSAYQVPSSPMTAANFEELIDAGELASMTTAQTNELQVLLTPGTVNIGDVPIQRDLNALFANYPTSLAAVQAKYTRNGSPWEYYFGAGQQATTGLLDAARNSGSGSNF